MVLTMTTTSTQLTIAGLWRYPVKSMGGEALEQTYMFSNGFLGDRRYALVDVETGEVVCAKVPRKWANVMNFSAAFVEEPAPKTPLPPVAITFPDGSVGLSDSRQIDARLSRELGREVRLVDKSPEGAASTALWRVVEGHTANAWTQAHTVGVSEGQDVVQWQLAEAVSQIAGEDTFFDLAPLHILTTATLRRLQREAPEVSFDAQRFRPNILLDTDTDGFVEQEWGGATLRIGDTSLAITFPTPRCVMPTLAQQPEGITNDRRVLQTIARHNMLAVDAFGEGALACLGVYGDPVVTGPLSVDAAVTLLGSPA